jgi:hypothetical protein
VFEKGGQSDTLLPTFIFSKTWLFLQTGLIMKAIFMLRFPSQFYSMELCLLKLRGRQAIMFEYAHLNFTWRNSFSSYERAKRYNLKRVLGKYSYPKSIEVFGKGGERDTVLPICVLCKTWLYFFLRWHFLWQR